ncbi:hypothetical protein NM688_g439 [Phlebia brevispora]|uniref:Uncharacterized protein n=1 Tax=Phlebia brevispora TaxID=194682 RepID=A0ACC1TE76_9APHY|nr:hypothetical protein NM688_g439 [Phlebia brevispora]
MGNIRDVPADNTSYTTTRSLGRPFIIFRFSWLSYLGFWMVSRLIDDISDRPAFAKFNLSFALTLSALVLISPSRRAFSFLLIVLHNLHKNIDTSYPSNNPGSHQSQDYGRSGISHSHSQPFTVAGMTSPGAAHSPSLRASSLAAANSLNVGGPLGDSLSQSRSHYQPGYLMSATPSSATSQSPRNDEAPIVQTKAKISSVLSGASAAEFGMDSMFQSSRQRTRATLADEDAPPTNSVNDLINEIYDSGPRRQPQTFSIDSPARSQLLRSAQPQTPARVKPIPPINAAKPLYVIVFGYPLDRYSVTVEYFRSLGETTESEQNAEIVNCFRIGYLNPAEAVRAVRKNGEVLSGAWMIGVKWADPVQAEAALGSSLMRSTLPPSTSLPESSTSPDVSMAESTSSRGFPSTESSLALATVPTVGTPLKLAPSTSAFRKPGSGGKPAHKPGEGMQGIIGGMPTQSGAPGVQPSPSKGMLGQMSDLIFGW